MRASKRLSDARNPVSAISLSSLTTLLPHLRSPQDAYLFLSHATVAREAEEVKMMRRLVTKAGARDVERECVSECVNVTVVCDLEALVVWTALMTCFRSFTLPPLSLPLFSMSAGHLSPSHFLACSSIAATQIDTHAQAVHNDHLCCCLTSLSFSSLYSTLRIIFIVSYQEPHEKVTDRNA